MTDARAIADSFYSAFGKRDGEAMASLYASDATFSDPVFPHLVGAEIGDMWRMLCERGKDLRVEHEILEADAESAKVRWQAWYTFAATKRHVHNVITATLVVGDGKLATHRDEFSFYRWSRMALGAPGLLLGWTPLLRNKVRKTAGSQLERYRSG